MTSQQRARFMSTLIPAALLAAIAAGCGDGQDPGADGETGGGGGSVGDVTGTVSTTFVTEQGDIMVPEDLSDKLIFALHQNAKGEWWSTTGIGKTDGSFTIPGVPEGPFFLHVGFHEYYTAAREIAFSSYQAGRADRVTPKKEVTITAQMTGLAPWAATDWLWWFAGNAGSSAPVIVSSQLGLGDTALDGFTIPWERHDLVDASKGDTLYFTQLSRHPGAEGAAYSTINRFARFDDVTMVDGATTAVTGTFDQAVSHQSVAIDFRASEFLSAGTAINPDAEVVTRPLLRVSTRPGASKHGELGYDASLVEVSPNAMHADPKLGTIDFDNPYPASWGAYGAAYVDVDVKYTVPGAEKTLGLTAEVAMTADLATLGAGPIRPPVTPVQAPTLNGQSALHPLVGITTTPTLSWSPPVVGSPRVYFIAIFDVNELEDGTQAFFYRGGFDTSETSVPIPPGRLEEGKPHVFQISAVVDPAVDPSHPDEQSVNHAIATALTSLVVP